LCNYHQLSNNLKKQKSKMVTDPIADFLTRVRNAQMARHRIVEIPASNLKKRITEILYEKGYILKYKFEDDNKQGLIKIALKYNAETKEPAIRSLERISRPGLRQYAKPTDIRRVKNGLGVAIVSTSKGVMTDKEARTQNVGGEVLCQIW
jgi:small subunit ribosomal protein S8